MEKKTFTSGEAARFCGISIRSVQYYDKRGIVSPSCSAPKDKRLYSSEDLRRLQLVCLYKSLGLSLQEISDLLHSEQLSSALEHRLKERLLEVEQEIEERRKQKEAMEYLLEELSAGERLGAESEEQLKKLLKQKERYRYLRRLTLRMEAAMLVLYVLLMLLAVRLRGIYPFLVLLLLVFLLAGLVYVHAAWTAYRCPYCGHSFTISFGRDLLSLHNGNKGKYLTCPSCQKKGWMKETFLREE